MARSTRGDAWTQTSARVIAKRKLHDEIVKLHTLGASRWTEKPARWYASNCRACPSQRVRHPPRPVGFTALGPFMFMRAALRWHSSEVRSKPDLLQKPTIFRRSRAACLSETVITQKAQERLIALFPLSIFWMEAGAHLRICLFHKTTIACWQGPSHRQSDLAKGVIESVRQLRA
jgi:hypothetical protein